MLFNSIDFAIFLPLVFFLYWFAFNRSIRLQNLFIVCASYVFYGWWDWRFLSLILFSSLVDYCVGLRLSGEDNQAKRKLLLALSIFVNIGFLGFFKYFNFFAASFADAYTILGGEIQSSRLNLILPVGISFYTFQTLSYTIDIYRRKMCATRDVVAFAAFVSFFPQLVAGPIERASNLLPQFFKRRNFAYSQAVDGMKQILWGLFKKIVIADNAAEYANVIFDNSESASGSTLLLGAVFFAVQIYGDFSGYSDIAIGTSRLFGFGLRRNFAFPYFSRDIGEFWRRWHISLSTWFRDYLYIPLGGSRGPLAISIRNVLLVFIVSGFWHGANWTFMFWGLLHALYFLPLLILQKNRTHTDTVATGKILPSVKEAFQIARTFLLVVLAWIFFRAESLGQAFSIINEIFSLSLFTFPTIARIAVIPAGLIGIFFIIEWFGRDSEYAIQKLFCHRKCFVRWCAYYSICVAIVVFKGNPYDFIYFQF